LLGLFFVFFSYIFLKKPLVTVFCVVFFLAGVYQYHHTIYSIPERLETPVYGEVVQEPSVRGNFQRITLKHQEGKALLYVERFADYDYGDVLKVEGDFEVPEGDYGNYLKKEGIYHTSFYPKAEKVGEEKNLFYEKIFSIKKSMRENIRQSTPIPQSFILEAVVLGDRDSFSEEFSEKLSISGTRHITAISGMHIVIISGILFYLFQILRIQRRWSAILSLVFIICFVFFVGAPASAVRAGIMGGALLLAGVVYREKESFRLVAFAGAAMLLFNPLLLHFDLGFQLSFLAVIGILSLYPVIKGVILAPKEVLGRKERKSVFLRTINAAKEKVRIFFKRNEALTGLLAVTVSAQIFVFPLILYNFGHVSLLSVPANLLIVPLLPLIMALGFLTGITGFALFSFPIIILLSFVLSVIDFFSSLPFSAIYIENFPIFLVVLFYAFLFYKIHSIRKKESFDFF